MSTQSRYLKLHNKIKIALTKRSKHKDALRWDRATLTTFFCVDLSLFLTVFMANIDIFRGKNPDIKFIEIKQIMARAKRH